MDAHDEAEPPLCGSRLGWGSGLAEKEAAANLAESGSVRLRAAWSIEATSGRGRRGWHCRRERGRVLAGSWKEERVAIAALKKRLPLPHATPSLSTGTTPHTPSGKE
jgi:hypothetical protein